MTAQGLRTKTNMVSRQKEIASTIADNKILLASMLHNTLKSFLVQLIGLGQFKFAIRILFTSLSSDVIYRFLFFIGLQAGQRSYLLVVLSGFFESSIGEFGFLLLSLISRVFLVFPSRHSSHFLPRTNYLEPLRNSTLFSY